MAGKRSAGVLLSLLSGAMLLVALRPFGGLWFLAPFAAAPMVLAQYRFFPRKLSWLAVWIPWLVYWMGICWIGARQLQPLHMVMLYGLALSFPGALFGFVDRGFNERTGFRFYLLTMPAVWTGWDFLVSGNPFNASEGQIYYLLGPAPALYQPVSIFGSPALTFVMLVFGTTIGMVLVRLTDSRRGAGGRMSGRIEKDVSVPPAAFRRILVAGVSLSAAWVILSLALFATAPSRFGAPARVAAIQPGTAAGYSDDALGAFTETTRDVYERLCREAAAKGAKFLLWPEAGLDFDPRVKDTEWIPSLARETGAWIQAAWVTVDSDKTQHNMAGLWDAEGTLRGIYTKQHPVLPAGEHFSQEPYFGSFDTPIGRLGMIICFDITFYSPSRIQAATGARMLAASVGDWLDVAASRVSTAQFRAVENGVAYIKGELIGASAMVDPRGVVVAMSAPPGDRSESVALVADLPSGGGHTLYTRSGDVFGILCAAGLFLRAWLQLRMTRRGRDGSR